MLVLSRKIGEKICIGEDITLIVVEIDQGRVRLGIEAPREVPVLRTELLARKQQGRAQPGENQAEAQPDGNAG